MGSCSNPKISHHQPLLGSENNIFSQNEDVFSAIEDNTLHSDFLDLTRRGENDGNSVQCLISTSGLLKKKNSNLING